MSLPVICFSGWALAFEVSNNLPGCTAETSRSISHFSTQTLSIQQSNFFPLKGKIKETFLTFSIMLVTNSGLPKAHFSYISRVVIL